MLYDNYQKRIQKLAAILSVIIKLLPLIVSVVSVSLLTTIVLLACKGMAGDVDCPSEIEYGNSYSCEAEAFWSDVRIEYSVEGSEEWSEIQPHMPGNYSVRAVGINVFDKDRFGDITNFAILPRCVDVCVKDARVVYGETPGVSAETVYGDIFYCDSVFFEDLGSETTKVTPDSSRIRFTDSQGADVTYAYSVNIITTDISFDKRELSITVGSASKEYDGTPLTLEAYEISGGTLAFSDSLGAVFSDSATDAGTVDNHPEFKILHSENGNLIDVTNQYKLKVAAGKLTVTKKVVTFITGSIEGEYNGQLFECAEFEIDPESSLVGGHTAYLESTKSIADSGNHKNSQVIKITDESGNDKTGNYSIYYKEGTISISPRPIKVTTASSAWVYDGNFHYSPEFTVDGLLSTHVAQANTSTQQIKYVGSAENRYNILVFDAAGRNITSNYAISYEYGTLEVTPRPITIKTDDGSWMYDGNPHSTAGYMVTSELSLISGDRVIPQKTTEVVNAGKAKNVFENVTILDASGNNRTDCYSITYKTGTLEITKRPISVKPDDTEKVYDSTPLYGGEVKLYSKSPNGLVAGHRISATPSGSRTNVGTSQSGVKSIKIYDSNNVNVTSNYSIKNESGMITVTKRPIVILTASDSKNYDGKPLTNHNFSVPSHSPYQLVVGHRISMSITGSQTKIGESPNTYNDKYTKITAQGTDVTANYEISYELGILKVNPYAVITVLTASDQKYYDGKALKNSNYELAITNGKLRSGHRVVVNVTGSITDPGTVPNEATAKVVDSSGKNVTASYELSVSPGTLKILEPGKNKSNEEIFFGKIKTDTGGTVYLRMESRGDYTGQEWNGAVPYGKTLPGGYSYNYLTSIALRNAGVTPMNAEIAECIAYMLPYYIGFEGNYDIPKSDTIYSSKMQDYTMTYYAITSSYNKFESLSGKLGEYAKYEKEYRSFVYKNYMKVDDRSRAYMEGLIAEQNFSLSDPNVIQKIATYIQHAAVYSLEYDPKLDMEENVAIAFLDKYKEGKCVHYASAATLLYRTLGIPARYVTGFMIETVKDTFVDIVTPGHAWVELYIDGIGWVQVEVTGSDNSGEGGEGAGEGGGGEGGEEGGEMEGEGGIGGLLGSTIELTPAYQYQTASQKTLYAKNELDVNAALSKLLRNGYTYSVKVSGARSSVGRGISKIESFVLYDPNGNDVTDQFDFVYKEGVLEVFESNVKFIEVSLYEIQKYYDGTPLCFEDGDYEVMFKYSDVDLKLSLNVELTDAGELTLSQLNSERDKYVEYSVTKAPMNVSSQYVVIFKTLNSAKHPYVPIRVDKRIISLSSATESKIEDGKPLTNDEVTISRGSLLAGHKIEAHAIGYIDYVGTVDNTIDYKDIKIYDSEGNDVTANYVTLYNSEGTLTIVSAND